MSQKEFFRPEARTLAAEAVKSVEAQTSAELVIALRRQSGSYRQVDYLVGFALALLALVGLLLAPQRFHPLTVPVELVVVWAVGTGLCASLAPLRRLLGGRVGREQVRLAARAAFYELGISRTSGRTGLLVYISMLERRVELVPDHGIDTSKLGEAWTAAVAKIEDSVRRPDLAAFLAAVRELGPILGKALPRSADDVNELPDEMSAP